VGRITIIGGGLAGLTAAIACAEGGAEVHLLEAHRRLGGRARSADGPYVANLGPHALYCDGPQWAWLAERDLLPPYAKPSWVGVRFRMQGTLRRTLPVRLIAAALRLRRHSAPADADFGSWATERIGEDAAQALSNAAGVYSFHHDPGSLAAAFVWERSVRVLLTLPPGARYPRGGWSSLVERLEASARALGVRIETGEPVDALPDPPVIVATELDSARALIGDPSLRWPSGSTVCLDLGLRHRRGDPYVVSDLDEAGWIERFTSPDPSLAPPGEELIQAQMPRRPGENAEEAAARLERLLDASLPDWRERETWRRRQLMDGRTGAIDPPGTTWRDRPAVDRGDGLFIAGDTVAAPGLLSEVAWASAIAASRGALAAVAALRPTGTRAHLGGSQRRDRDVSRTP
jgi:phytoene dehydrogenase-like protein